jgi:hypothetical protein
LDPIFFFHQYIMYYSVYYSQSLLHPRSFLLYTNESIVFHCNKHEIFDNRLYPDRIHPLKYSNEWIRNKWKKNYLPIQREPTSDIYWVSNDFPGSLSKTNEIMKYSYSFDLSTFAKSFQNFRWILDWWCHCCCICLINKCIQYTIMNIENKQN